MAHTNTSTNPLLNRRLRRAAAIPMATFGGRGTEIPSTRLLAQAVITAKLLHDSRLHRVAARAMASFASRGQRIEREAPGVIGARSRGNLAKLDAVAGCRGAGGIVQANAGQRSGRGSQPVQADVVAIAAHHLHAGDQVTAQAVVGRGDGGIGDRVGDIRRTLT